MSKKEEKAKRIAKRKKMLIFAKKIAKQITREYPNTHDRLTLIFLANKIMDVELFIRD